MSERKKPYPFDEFEPKWQAAWEESGAFRTAGPGDEGFDGSRPKYFVLDMFPYPSGQGLHVGHPEGYTATDIVARYKRRKGFNVLHPMGWDAFGLPAEQYAIKTGQHPRVTTEANVANFKRQLKSLGFAYDWEREVNTTDPGYVRWTQWIFLQLYHSYVDPETGKARPVSELEAKGWDREAIDAVRLAYVAESPVNWSPTLGTVLANEEVEEWREKGETVERRPLRQWMLRITAYAQRLIDDLELLDWPESVKLLQRNWIGRSEGATVRFKLSGREDELEVYTTRPDTLFGATYMVLAPEHPLVDEIVSDEQRGAVEAYRQACAAKSDLERTELAKEKTGVPTGATAVNPVNGEAIPVWIADYVLMGYGTGAIMAVPAHDERDYEFANEMGLEIRQVVAPKDEEFDLDAFYACQTRKEPSEHLIEQARISVTDGAESHSFGYRKNAYPDAGHAVNSQFLDGLATPEAKAKITAWLEEKGLGEGTVNYKLRDWLFSRQRYWGEPFPVVWEDGAHRAIGDDELPLLQPELEDFKPTGSPEGPLAKAEEWIAYSETAKRETNTMPQWAGSCWYYLRYCDAQNAGAFAGKEALDYWLGEGDSSGVDLYIGGMEHAVLHLLYARFWHKVLFDLGHVPGPEPFHGLVNQGLILGEDGQKMSKSRGNVVNPDEVVRDYGADSLRLYLMFMGPLRDSMPWSMKGVEGVHRFLARVWRSVMEQAPGGGEWSVSAAVQDVPADGDKGLRKVVHETVKKVSEDVEKLAFNTAISQMMVCTNALTGADVRPLESVVTLLGVLNPFAPHLTEELYDRLKANFPQLGEAPLGARDWPTWDEAFLVEDEVEIVLQVNGKLRDKMKVAKDAEKEAVEAAALENAKVKEFTEGLTVRKVIVVPGRLVNVVAN